MRHGLRYYEAREFEKQKKRGFEMLNGDGVQSKAGRIKAVGLIKKHNASAKKRRTTCK